MKRFYFDGKIITTKYATVKAKAFFEIEKKEKNRVAVSVQRSDVFFYSLHTACTTSSYTNFTPFINTIWPCRKGFETLTSGLAIFRPAC